MLCGLQKEDSIVGRAAAGAEPTPTDAGKEPGFETELVEVPIEDNDVAVAPA